jgi:hypothetical protein
MGVVVAIAFFWPNRPNPAITGDRPPGGRQATGWRALDTPAGGEQAPTPAGAVLRRARRDMRAYTEGGLY